MSKIVLNENTVIEIGKSIPLSSFRNFFIERTGKECAEFQTWLNMQAGKTIKEAIKSYGYDLEPKSMQEIMSEQRFNYLSEPDKAFIVAFDKKINELGYDFGGRIGDGHCWGKNMVIYSKIGIKNKKVIARIYIRENGIVLRLFFNNINKHKAYIENAPEHINDVFVNHHGNCSCNPKQENCRMRKSYLIKDKLYEKCGGSVFEFYNPTEEKLKDYIELLAEFYPIKKQVKQQTPV